MNLLKNNGWKCLWRGHPAQPTDQLKPKKNACEPSQLCIPGFPCNALLGGAVCVHGVVVVKANPLSFPLATVFLLLGWGRRMTAGAWPGVTGTAAEWSRDTMFLYCSNVPGCTLLSCLLWVWQ